MSDFRRFPGIFNDIYDRSTAKPGYDRGFYREGTFAQAADINEEFSRSDLKRRRIGDLVARDGDRIAGADIITVDIGNGTYSVTGGKIYVRGDVRDVAGAQLTGVRTTGTTQIGVRVIERLVDHEQDPDLLGLHPGTFAEGEPGGIRVAYDLAWGHVDDGEEGDLYSVYTLVDGQPIDQAPPPDLSGVIAQIALYDYGAHENYIDEGCLVTALGKMDGKQVFSIGSGIANILGFKRTRTSDTRYAEIEQPDIEVVDAEPQVYNAVGGVATITVNHTPINGVSSVVIEKEFTETITRGVVANSNDLLSQSSVLRIVSITQGQTTFAPDVSYTLANDHVSWSPNGPEPAPGSSYTVVYRYLDTAAPSQITDTTLQVSGGVDGGQVILSYSFKLPRVDQICLDQTGAVVYLKGISSREHPQPPKTPKSLLALCEVRNSWMAKPEIVNNGTRNMPYWQIWRLYRRLIELLDLTSLARMQLDIHTREPTAKHRVFVDPFESDRYRDLGELQSAAVFLGTCQLAIDPTFEQFSLDGPQFLDYTEEVIIRQEYVTNCHEINPYDVFLPLPLRVTITPSEDFWEEIEEVWLSDITRVFGWQQQGRIPPREIIEDITTRAARFLRQIEVAVTIGELGQGETVDVLTFDGIDVNPGGLVGNVSGQASTSFTIPANITAGVKQVYVKSGSGSVGSARFEGRGVITTITRQRIINIFEERPDDRFADGENNNRGDGGGGNMDPLAQTFMLDEDRHITSIDVKFCKIGDPSKRVICEIVTVRDGTPTTEVIAQVSIDMATVTVGTWTKFDFNFPVFIGRGQEHAFVFKTDDPDHSLSTAVRGGYDESRQEWVGAQPYTIGVLLSSSNARTWTPHQDEDLAMRVHAAVFSPTQKIVTIGTIDAVQMSDFIAMANTFLPAAGTSIRFRVTPENGDPQILEPGQNWERSSYFNGDLVVEAILIGTSKVSPIMGRNVLCIPGSIRQSGTYISRLYAMGSDVRQDVRLKQLLPVGSAVAVHIDKGDGNWQALTVAESEALADGSFDRRYTAESWDAPNGGRVRVTLTGGPGARPALYDLRSYSI